MDWLSTSIGELDQKINEMVKTVRLPSGEERAAIYTRISRLETVYHGYSMEIQPDRAEEYARSKGWSIYAIYEDPAKTGRNSRRMGLQRMLVDIRSGRVTVVVVHRLDRLYRNLESLLKFIRMIKRYQVRLVSVTEQIDTDNWWGRLVLYVLGALAEMYIWQTSVRTREAKLERVMNGLPNGSYRFGYCNGLCSSCSDPNGKGYCPLYGQPDRIESQRGRIPVPHPIESQAVRVAVHLYSKGKSDLEIASAFNRHHFRLPDGGVVQFRTKGLPGKSEPGEFSRDNIREIIRSPFHVGLVAHYPTRPLDMEDDPENLKRIYTQPLLNRRVPLALQTGRHSPIYPYSMWEANMQRRSAKGRTPTNSGRPRREYLLTGIGRCWVCHELAKKQAGFRGSAGRDGFQYYRCATLHDKSKRRGSGNIHDEMPDAVGVIPEGSRQWNELLKAHPSATLHAEEMEKQVQKILESFVIPQDWYELIMAYFLSDDGMADFERNRYHLRQELTRVQTLYSSGYLTQAQFIEQARSITTALQSVQVTDQPEVQELKPYISDFKRIWIQATTGEQRNLLKVMFTALYFDGEGSLHQIMANAPFEQLIP